MAQALNQLRVDDRQLDQQQETIESLEKLRDFQAKQATEQTTKVSVRDRLIRINC